MLTSRILVSVCFGVAIHLLLSAYLKSVMAPTTPAPHGLVPLGLAVLLLSLGTNVIVTTLIAGRIWYLSPRKARKMGSVQFPTGIGRAAIDIIIESGMLYLAAQLIFVVLFAIRHPALSIAEVIVVQIYVCIPHPWKAENSSPKITQGIAPTLIIIRTRFCTQSGPICSESPSSMHFTVPSLPTSSTQVRINSELGRRRRLSAEMPISEIKSKRNSEDLGLTSSSGSIVATVNV